MAGISQDEDKRDIAILHSEGQYNLAREVKTSIESACSTVHPAVRVDVFDDLHGLGRMATQTIDDMIDTSGIVMFFRCEEFFSKLWNDYSLAAAVEDRVNHKESRRHYTIVPLDIKKKTKVPGKPSINGLNGLIVTEDGSINDQYYEKIINIVTNVRKTAARFAVSSGERGLRDQSTGDGGVLDQSTGNGGVLYQSTGNGGVLDQSTKDSMGLEEAIEEGQSQQKEEIGVLFHEAPVNYTPSAVSAERTSRDPNARADNRPPGGTIPSAPQSATERSKRGLGGPTQQDDDAHTRQTEVTSRGSPSLQQDPHSCPQGGNPPELNPEDRNPSAAPSTSGICLPAERGIRETRVTNNLGDENNSSDLPHSVSPDKQSFTSCPPSFSQHRAAEPESPSQPFQRHRQSRNSGPVIPQGNLVQQSSSVLRNYWNQMGARPKDSYRNCPAPALPLAEQWTNQLSAEQRSNQLADEQRTNQLSVNMGQGQRPTAAERHPAGLHNRQFDNAAPQHLPNLRNHDSNEMNSLDSDLLNIMNDLENTRLTPPPSPSHDGDHFNMQGGPELSNSLLYQAQHGCDMLPSREQFPLPAFTAAEGDQRLSPTRASLQPSHSAGEVGGESQCHPHTPAWQYGEHDQRQQHHHELQQHQQLHQHQLHQHQQHQHQHQHQQGEAPQHRDVREVSQALAIAELCPGEPGRQPCQPCNTDATTDSGFSESKSRASR